MATGCVLFSLAWQPSGQSILTNTAKSVQASRWCTRQDSSALSDSCFDSRTCNWPLWSSSVVQRVGVYVSICTGTCGRGGTVGQSAAVYVLNWIVLGLGQGYETLSLSNFSHLQQEGIRGKRAEWPVNSHFLQCSGENAHRYQHGYLTNFPAYGSGIDTPEAFSFNNNISETTFLTSEEEIKCEKQDYQDTVGAITEKGVKGTPLL